MSILIDKNTKVVVQGITGGEGSFHGRQMVEYGTRVVAGVTPGKAGQKVDDIPVFNRVEDAVKQAGANASCIFVPAAFAADAIVESVDAGVDLVVCITEGIPVLEMVRVRSYTRRKPGTDQQNERHSNSPCIRHRASGHDVTEAFGDWKGGFLGFHGMILEPRWESAWRRSIGQSLGSACNDSPTWPVCSSCY